MVTSPFSGTRTITSIDVHREGEVGRILRRLAAIIEVAGAVRYNQR